MTIGDLVRLAEAGTEDAGHVIETIYTWYRDRTMSIVKATLGAGASLLITLLISFFKAELETEWWTLVPVGTGALSAIAYGLWRFNTLQTVNREYFAAIEIFNLVKPLVGPSSARGAS